MNRKKGNKLLYLMTTIASAYLGYIFARSYTAGMNILELVERVNITLETPFSFAYWSRDAPKIIFMFILLGNLALFLYLSSRYDLMSGKEYGTAKFGSTRAITKKFADKDDTKNRILSQNVKVSTDSKKTKLNNNVLVVGGSGSGKTYFFLTGNVLNLSGSIIISDPKGSLIGQVGETLRRNGYIVKCLNTKDMSKSDRFNPFQYIRSETDIIKLITNLIQNTTPKNAQAGDPFWEKSETLFLQSLFLYVWLEKPEHQKNFNSVMELLRLAEYNEDESKSDLDYIFEELKETSELGEYHPAYVQYTKCMRGAGDTVRSIIISANARLAYLENSEVKRLLSGDDLDITSIGAGKDGDGKTKTALFLVTPDDDTSYSFVIGMFYTVLFQQLYHVADVYYRGSLPLPVTVYWDEYYAIKPPENVLDIFSTCRSRNIGIVCIVQNVVQMKVTHKDSWEMIPGNCDFMVYLGGNEQASHKYFVESLGKGTVYKRSNGETRGRNGSSSRNYDVLGRELLTQDEIRKIPNSKCLVLIRGEDVILDNKFNPVKHPRYKHTSMGGGKFYVHQPAIDMKEKKEKIEFLNESSLQYFMRKRDGGGNVFIDEISASEFMKLGESREQDQTLEKRNRHEIELSEILKRMSQHQFSDAQIQELYAGMDNGLESEQILQYFRRDYEADRMSQIRAVLEKEQFKAI